MVELRLADWPAGLAWYRDVLGLTVALIDEPNRFALLDAGPCRVALKQGVGGRDGLRLIFRVDDLDAERDRLASAGVAVSGPFENREERYREVRLADPEGTPIRLFARDEPPG